MIIGLNAMIINNETNIQLANEKTMNELLSPILSFFGGVLITLMGWNIQKRMLQQQSEEHANRLICSMSTLCSERIKKMLLAYKQRDAETYKVEKYLLGGDADRYLMAIARRTRISETELGLFRRMNELMRFPITENSLSDRLVALCDALETMR